MTEETTGAEAPAGGEAIADTTTAENADTATAQQSDADNQGDTSASDDTGDTTGDDAAAKQQKRERFSGRISELVRQRNEAEQRAQRAEARLNASRQVDLSDLDYDDQIAEKTIQRSRQEQVENERAAAQDLAFQAFKARESLVAEKYTDYAQVAHRGWEPTPAMLEVILDSERGPEIAYHLGKNPEEVAKIAALSPTRQAAELGKLEAKLSGPRSLPRQPPAPVQPVSGIAAGGSKDPGAMSMSEYAAWRKANP